MTGPKYFIEFFTIYLALSFGTQKSDFECKFVELLFIINILCQESWDCFS